MDFTIITPSFKQLDYLSCCIASVADQGAEGSENVGMCESGNVAPLRSVSAGSLSYAGLAERLSVEHIVQDAGSPGIEEFAEKTAERLLGRYGGERVTKLEAFELLHIRTAHGYTLRIFKEKDSGMYDAVNKGLKKGTGKICAYLNCDEQYLEGVLTNMRLAFGQHLDWDVIFAGVVIVDPAGRLICLRRASKLYLPHLMTCSLPNFTAAMFYRRNFLETRQAWFDSSLRDVADMVWVMARLREGTRVGRAAMITSSFADTGENMNLTPNAWMEAGRLKKGVPRWMLMLKPWWLIRHRLGKLIEGDYWPKPFGYSIFQKKQLNARMRFHGKRSNPIWWARLHVEKPKLEARGTQQTFTKRDRITARGPRICQRIRNLLVITGRFIISKAPDELFSKIQFLVHQGRLPNLKIPKSFNEKVQWLKLNYRDPLVRKCANKLLVREYVKDNYGSEILVPLVGCYESVQEIGFEDLPQRFACKASHGSGWNIVATDKAKLNWALESQKLKKWMATDFSTIGREWAYKNSPKKILIEEFLDGPDGQSPYDYKIFCFNGTPRFVQVDTDRFSEHRRSFYDLNWQQLSFGLEYPIETRVLPRPMGLDKMIEIAKKLSKPFPFVRCDLYDCKGQVYFGELTFYPEKGTGRFNPRKADNDVGAMLSLSNC